jgi:hypothetical protein
MADTRVLKVGLAADISDFSKGLDKANKESETFGDKLGSAAKAGALALAAAGAAAIKVGIELAKNAAEDASAQRILALTLENTTKATDAQVAAVEKYISATSLAFGVTDDQLRPAFARLTRSTKDVEESQKLLNLALDISVATGKPVEAIATGLSKAYDGNTNALGKLGLGIDQSILKTKDFDKVYGALRENFAGFAEQEANTFEGKLRRLQVAFDEGKETIGAYILDAVTPLVTLTVEKLIPAFQEISEKLGKVLGPALQGVFDFIKAFFVPMFGTLKDAFDTVKDAIDDNRENIQPLLDLFKDLWVFVKDNIIPILGTTLVNTVKTAANAIATAIRLVSPIIEAVTGAIRTAINLAIDGINLLISAYNKVNFLIPGAKDVSQLSKLGASGGPSTGAVPFASGFAPAAGSSGTTGGGTTPTPNSAGGSGASGGSSSGASTSSSGASSGSIGSFNAGSFRLAESGSMESLLNSGAGITTSSGVNTNTLAGIMAASGGVNVNINMGVVGDPAGAARAVQQLLTDEATISGNYLGGVGNSRFAAVAV